MKTQLYSHYQKLSCYKIHQCILLYKNDYLHEQELHSNKILIKPSTPYPHS